MHPKSDPWPRKLFSTQIPEENLHHVEANNSIDLTGAYFVNPVHIYLIAKRCFIPAGSLALTLYHIEPLQELTICHPSVGCGFNGIPGRCLDKILAIVCQLYSAEAAKK